MASNIIVSRINILNIYDKVCGPRGKISNLHFGRVNVVLQHVKS